MDDAFRVRRVQRIRDLDGQGQQRLQFQRPVADQMLQSLPSRNSMAMNAWPFSSPMS